MPSLTLKDLPAPLLRALRASAHAERRSLNQQVQHLLAGALGLDGGHPVRQADVEAQVAAWRRLAGRWESDQGASAEAADLRKARTRGRKVEL